MFRVIHLVTIISGIVILLTACARVNTPSQTPENNPNPSTSNTTSNDTGTISAEADYTIELSSYTFNPSTIQAKAGQTIWVKLINRDNMHDFVIDELKVQSPQLKQQDEESMVRIDIPANAAGKKYEYYCSVGSHKQMGMVGTLEVVE